MPTQARLVGIERSVFFSKTLQLFRQLVDRVNRVRGTDWHTSAAVDTAVGIDIELGGSVEFGFVFLGMNAVGWAGIDTEQIFDALVGYRVSYEGSLDI